LSKIKEFCAAQGIILLEDNCEALGTELPEGKAGNFGVVGTFSFFVAHHMSTIEGGMAVTDNEDIAEMLRIVRANGWDRNLNALQQQKWRKRYGLVSEFEAKYSFYDLAYNMRPTEITGFLGLFQLRFLRENILKRQENYLRLEKVTRQNSELLALDHSHISFLSSFAMPVVCKTPSLRKKYLEQFAGAGVEVRPMIAGNMQKQPFYRKYVDILVPLPSTEFIDACGFYCGNYPELTEQDLETLTSCLGEI
jgi:CDP-6-deoxy-D-xylo-4-hexulose-3-dehydrase